MSHLDEIGKSLCRNDPVVGRLLLLAHPHQAGQHPVHDHGLHLGLGQHLNNNPVLCLIFFEIGTFVFLHQFTYNISLYFFSTIFGDPSYDANCLVS